MSVNGVCDKLTETFGGDFKVYPLFLPNRHFSQKHGLQACIIDIHAERLHVNRLLYTAAYSGIHGCGNLAEWFQELGVLMRTVLNIAVFISAFLILPLGLHYWLYASLARFCAISNPAARKTLLGILAFLALGFLPSVILIRFHWNFLTRLFYQVVCLWLGLFLHLLMALILLWVLESQKSGFDQH
jgi:hypothetical protein